MSESYTNGQLGDMIATGFKEVHKRQDKTNGRIGRLELWKAKMLGMGIVILAIVVPLALNVFGEAVKAYFESSDQQTIEQLIEEKVAERTSKFFIKE